MENIEELLAHLSMELRPTHETLEKARILADRLVKGIEEYFGPRTASIEGSYAKGTMVRSREEVDVFIHFKPHVPIERAAEQVLVNGMELIRRLGGSVKLRYASHPYVEGFIDGLRVNLVPCYDTEPGKWITPVDRTPYHTKYVRSMLDERMADDVRLLKAFLMSDGLYGAEIRYKGFSGYVCELLIIKMGSFLKLLEKVAEWRPPVILDGDKDIFRGSPLILPDPVDESRNAASAVSTTTLSKFIMKSKLFLRRPSKHYFTDTVSIDIKPNDRCFVAILLDVPERPPDVLWGELNRTAEGLVRGLEKNGFKPFRWDCWSENKTAVLIFELESLSLPKVYLHVGPPVWSRNAVDFVDEQMKKQDIVAYPWIYGERLFSLRRRRHTHAVQLIKHLIEEGRAAVSKELRPFLKTSQIIDDLEMLSSKLSPDGRMFLKEFIRTCPRFIAKYYSLS